MGFQVTTCPGCACGCGTLLEEETGVLTAAHPISSHPVSKGSLCIRGWNCVDSWRHPDRLTRPLLRKDDDLRPVSADVALDFICSRLEDAPHGSVAFAVAPSVSNEDILAVRRLAQFLRARVCSMDVSGVVTARRAMAKVLGRRYCSSSLEVLERARLIWVFGADVENYPQVASALAEAESSGGRVVSFDTFREPEKKGRRQVFVPPEEFGLLVLQLQRCVLEKGLVPQHVASQAGVAELAAEHRKCAGWPSSAVLQLDTIRELVESFFACPDSAVVIGDRWLTIGPRALEQTAQLLQAAALMGAEDRTVIAAGEVNSWGLADLLEPLEAGFEILAGWLNGETSDISVLITCGDDLLRSAPCPGNVKDALGMIGTVIVLDRFRNELGPFANVVLPTACFAEVDGTVTNLFGMVQRWRRAVPAPGEAQQERVWLGRIASRLGLASWPETALEWWRTEPGAHSAYDLAGLSALYDSDGSAGWQPRESTCLTICPPSGPLTSHTPGDPAMQAIFTRHPANWMTGAWSGRDEILRRESVEPVLSVAPPDLEERGIRPGGSVRLVTREGSAVFQARADGRLPRGMVLLAELPGRREIPRSLLAGSEEGFTFQPVPCRLERV
ncbi:MAG: molybdopterin oxidoreductase family protein [Acidobacteriota bacterium]